MTLKARWLPTAVQDLEAAHDWYEARQAGLGRELARELDTAIERALRHPHKPKEYEHPQLPAVRSVRKVQLKRFSEYGLIYTVDQETLWIVAVAHASAGLDTGPTGSRTRLAKNPARRRSDTRK